MAYASWSVVFGEQPSAAKWNILGTNDASFNDGTGFADNVAGGWIPYETVIPTRASADDPTYVVTFSGVDLTAKIGVGMRVSWVQNAIRRYGIVTAISFSTNTSMTILTRCDDSSVNYDVLDTSSNAITGFQFSPHKSPVGFPLEAEKWTLKLADTSAPSQATPVQNTWYNLGSLSLDIHIGCWDVQYWTTLRLNDTTSATFLAETTLSTANNSASDAEFTARVGLTAGSGIYGNSWFTKRKHVTVASKTTYYLNERATDAGVDSLNINSKTDIRAVCAYL